MIDKELISKKIDKLELAKAYLKENFIGIDNVIDLLIEKIKIWYIMPDLMERPLIINLWGITGVGKTDLVRKLVRFLEFSDKFCEIQMDGEKNYDNIELELKYSIENNDEPSILLLDEIQRFRTVDEKGYEKSMTAYQDIWSLLSDGQFPSDNKKKKTLLKMILDSEVSKHKIKNKSEDTIADESEENTKYFLYQYEATQLKDLLKLSESIEEIMQWSNNKKIEMLKNNINNNDIYEGNKYHKLLIIISGNLDEAFVDADNVDDADCDADIYHANSLNINVTDIKYALTTRFKPEQIARFGNNHIIYPILNSKNYEDLIKFKVDKSIKNIKSKFDIDIVYDNKLIDIIYRNGVFPTQGTRPLFSTINNIFDNSIVKFLYNSLINNKKTIKLFIENNHIVNLIDNSKVELDLSLDKIKDSICDDELAQIAVHEAGHAIVYAIINNIAPIQVNGRSNRTSGFVGVHSYNPTKQNILNDITTGYGGYLAELLVFGKDKISSGAVEDLNTITQHASNMVRLYGLDSHQYTIMTESSSDFSFISNDSDIEDDIKTILNYCYNNCITIIKNNYKYLIEISKNILDKGTITPEEFVVISKKYYDLDILDKDAKIIDNFHDILSDNIKTLDE